MLCLTILDSIAYVPKFLPVMLLAKAYDWHKRALGVVRVGT